MMSITSTHDLQITSTLGVQLVLFALTLYTCFTAAISNHAIANQAISNSAMNNDFIRCHKQ